MEEAIRPGVLHQERGWKLFLLIPRLLLHRPPRGGLVPKSKLVQRFDDFARGDWEKLFQSSDKCDEEASRAYTRKRRRQKPEDDITRRAARALALVQMGELSAGRQALEGADLAPGNMETLRELRDPVRRQPEFASLFRHRSLVTCRTDHSSWKSTDWPKRRDLPEKVLRLGLWA